MGIGSACGEGEKSDGEDFDEGVHAGNVQERPLFAKTQQQVVRHR
jgi:hypothetical protein